jgi:hypothetical protein
MSPFEIGKLCGKPPITKTKIMAVSIISEELRRKDPTFSVTQPLIFIIDLNALIVNLISFSNLFVKSAEWALLKAK